MPKRLIFLRERERDRERERERIIWDEEEKPVSTEV